MDDPVEAINTHIADLFIEMRDTTDPERVAELVTEIDNYVEIVEFFGMTIEVRS